MGRDLAEYVLRLRAEVRRLHGVTRELDVEHDRRAKERRLWRDQRAVARRETAVNAVWVEVWDGRLPRGGAAAPS